MKLRDEQLCTGLRILRCGLIRKCTELYEDKLFVKLCENPFTESFSWREPPGAGLGLKDPVWESEQMDGCFAS